MKFRKYRWVFIVIGCVFAFHDATGKKIRNRQYKFTITIPDAMKRIVDTTVLGDELYYDTSAKIIFMISERKSKFSSVADYIDCSKAQLESQLKEYYADSALKLLSCNRSIYYPKKTTAVMVSVSVLPYGFNTCFVYFIHHKMFDIQFTFTFKKEAAGNIAQYVDGIMETMTLR